MTERSFIPFARPAIGEEEIAEVVETLRSGWIALGPRTRMFEKELASHLGVDEVLAVSSGTAALHLSLLALGIGPGDEVVVPTYTFASTATTVLHVGARPVLVDVEPATLTIDCDAAAAAITSRTRAIVPVHLGGTTARMDAILPMAAGRGLAVLEDTAHALPTSYRGRAAGTLGSAGAFSFYATKTLATAEGGAVVAQDPKVRQLVRRLSMHGMDASAWNRFSKAGSWRYDVTVPGYKYNFTDIQAALGLHQLRKLAVHAEARTAIASAYTAAFAGLPGAILPATMPGSTHSWHLYLLRFDDSMCGFTRDTAHTALRDAGIGSNVHYIPLHQFTLYREMNAGRVFPVADTASAQVLSLPIYPSMSADDRDRVIDAVIGLWRRA